MGNRPAEEWHVFSDESGLDERHIAIGAIFIPGSSVAAAADTLDGFCSARGFPDREMSWKKCSKGEVDRYEEFVAHFWNHQQAFRWEFRSLVIDTKLNPLKHPESGATTEEVGFYKFYHSFLTSSVQIVAPDASAVRLHVAEIQDQYKHRTEILGKTVAGSLRKVLPSSFEIVTVNRSLPRASRIHQLADVLTGAVTYRISKRDAAGKSHKRSVCETVERFVGRRLDLDFRPVERPFNVWSFAPTGSPRWAPGSSGRA